MVKTMCSTTSYNQGRCRLGSARLSRPQNVLAIKEIFTEFLTQTFCGFQNKFVSDHEQDL